MTIIEFLFAPTTSVRPIFTLACVLAMAGGHALAEDASSLGQESEVSEIIVTATRLEQPASKVPASISVVSGDEIQDGQQQLGLDEALSKVPGLFFQNRYNFAQDLRIAIRGFGARSNFGVRGIKILVDGMPETLADGQSQVDSIDLGSIKQVEVLRGPASAIHGNAAGGVISLRTEIGDAEPFVETRIAAGDFGYNKNQIKAGGVIGRLDYLVSLSDLSIDGYREHSEAENTQLNSLFRFRPNDRSELSLMLSATDQPVSNDPGGLTQSAAIADPRAARDQNLGFNAGEILDQQKAGLRYEHTTANGLFAIRNYYLRRNFYGRLPFTGGGIVAFDRFFAGGGASYEWQYQTRGFQHRLIAGIDYDRQSDDRQRYDNNDGIQGALVLDQEERVTNLGIFVQDQITVSDRLEMTVGLRYDIVDFSIVDLFPGDGDDSGSRSIDDVSPSVGITYAISDQLMAYGNISTAFETPTATEFANPDGGGGLNPSLEPQKSSSYELGLRGSMTDNSQYEISVFTIDVEDELIPFEIESSPGRNFFDNAGESRRRGLEMTLGAEPVPGLNLGLSYTWSKFEFETFVDNNGSDYSGNTIPGIPSSFARADFSYTHESGGFIAVDVMYADDLYANNANSAEVDGYTLANIRLGLEKTIGDFEIRPFIGVNNLTDEAYTANVRLNAFGGRFFEPGPERSTYGGISLRYRY